jgi:hypothetical protein
MSSSTCVDCRPYPKLWTRSGKIVSRPKVEQGGDGYNYEELDVLSQNVVRRPIYESELVFSFASRQNGDS